EPFRRFEVVRATYASLGRDKAKDEVRALRREFPSFPLADELTLWLADRAAEEGDTREARRLFQEVVDRFPQSPLEGYALAGVAHAAFAQKDYAGARRAFEAIAATDSVAAQFVSAREVELI